LRALNISLAAKCQILFGVAVLSIIAAALAVPWHRTEQLTEQLDQRAAKTLVDHVLLEHISRSGVRDPGELEAIKRTPELPRLMEVNTPRISGTFESRAMAKFLRQPDVEFYARDYTRKDGTKAYRYARALYVTGQCMQCHENGKGSAAPTTQPNALLGLASVDIESQVETSQLLLNRLSFLAAGLLAGALAVAAFYIITTRLILQPVRVLQETAERVSEGDLNIRSDISTGDEFQQLSETFNAMLGNLKRGADQLRAINKGLDLKLGQLSETNLALYESNRLKSEFLANVSHELRTPLNSILGFAELLKDSIGPEMDAKQSRFIQNILGSGRNLLDLINDLLDLAKIEAGKMEVRSEQLSLPDVFEGLGNILKPQMEARKLVMELDVAGDVPIVQTDPAKLQQVLYNFLSNALKFSPPSGRIVLAAKKTDAERIYISVTDEGPGIEQEKHKIIFEKFRQIDASVTREHGGSGLGLSISKELVTLLGGTIGVESEPGHGATFWIELPKAIEAGTQDIRGRMVTV